MNILIEKTDMTETAGHFLFWLQEKLYSFSSGLEIETTKHTVSHFGHRWLLVLSIPSGDTSTWQEVEILLS